MEQEPHYDKMPESPVVGGELKKVYFQITKDSEQEAHYHPMPVYEYGNGEIGEWKHLTQAAPVIIGYPEVEVIRRKDKMAFVMNDPHFGFRRQSGEYIPTHDPEFLDKFIQMCIKHQPEKIIINGDGIDLPELSRFEPDSKAMVDTTQMSIDTFHKFLAILRKVCPHTEIVYMEGNHDLRAAKILLKNSMPLFGIRQANMPEDFPVTSVPFLLRLNELDIRYISGYPANYYKINERLRVMHSEFATQHTATKLLGVYSCSICFGHTHRAEMVKYTSPDGVRQVAFNPGCACKTDGTMPSVHNAVDVHGEFVERQENWQKGMAVIRYQDGNKPFTFDLVDFDQDIVKYENKSYKARPEIVEVLRGGK